jgi:starch synthase (maltosyl-transferring)
VLAHIPGVGSLHFPSVCVVFATYVARSAPQRSRGPADSQVHREPLCPRTFFLSVTRADKIIEQEFPPAHPAREQAAHSARDQIARSARDEATRPALRIYYIHPLLAGPLSRWPDHLGRARRMGFTHVCAGPIFAPSRHGDIFLSDDPEETNPAIRSGNADATAGELAGLCRDAGLALLLDLMVDRVAADGIMARAAPHWFHRNDGCDVVDPRKVLLDPDAVPARFDAPQREQELAAWWTDRMLRLAHQGVTGFRLVGLAGVPPRFVQAVIRAVRQEHAASLFAGWTPGVPRARLAGLEGAGLDAVFASSPWWDGRASWFVEEQNALRRIAPSIGVAEAPFEERLASRFATADTAGMQAGYRHALQVAAATGHGLFVPMGFELGARARMDPQRGAPDEFARDLAAAAFDLSEEIEATNRMVDRRPAFPNGDMRALTGPGDPVSALMQFDAPDARTAERARLVLINTAEVAQPFALDALLAAAGAPFVPDAAEEFASPLAPGAVRVIPQARTKPVTERGRRADRTLSEALKAPRIAIERITPAVDGGAIPVKRVVGQIVTVEADIITDGHDIVAAELLWKGADEKDWTRAPLTPLGNDRWQARFAPRRIGRHLYTVEAWRDDYASLVHEIEVKHKAGVDVALELIEARHYLEAVVASAPRAFRLQHVPLTLEVERPQAGFASWYELFPRSQSGDPARHGTFDDVIARLPDVRRMGFDVLYFPPIHPIGRKNRKGRNNTLTPTSDDVGSPYAIGSEEGGHDAIHSQLGTLDDFRRLVAAARDNELEIALDFAIQCSPDHPWLRDHPDWFKWRPDGTIKYAENPPKKYQDIVNVDFYGEGAPALWAGLRDVVLFWAGVGVRIFRVDNPHTKPLPFWQWMIAEVRARHPDVIFLSEAFTRPKLMYRLAKVGFSQSYTYFTWRNTKPELTDYLVELSTTEVKEFFRPHFFVNTPDINPYFLQTSGRAGFLIRAALAATLSGLWGVYAGFELCEAAALPGREEYLDSEKYEIRVRDPNAPGNIVAEITRLNALRRAYPALQSHLNVTFYNAFNDAILLYGRRLPGHADMILVAVSLDPHHVQEAAFELPLWEWKLPDHGALYVEDLMRGSGAVWNGKLHHLRLDPAHPFAIWRLTPPESGSSGGVP